MARDVYCVQNILFYQIICVYLQHGLIFIYKKFMRKYEGLISEKREAHLNATGVLMATHFKM